MSWSVIIPTLWKPASFPTLLRNLDTCKAVSEIILVDNAPSAQPKGLSRLKKLVLLPQSDNIYVNPAWNLGIKYAKSEKICICNDDVLFDCDLIFGHFDTQQLKGITGIHPDSFDPSTWNEGEPIRSTDVHIKQMWACLFFLPKAAYVPIPNQLKIWWGDAWLAWHVRPATSIITKVQTKHSESVGDPAFNPITAHDTELWIGQFKPTLLHVQERKAALISRIQSKLRRTFSR